MYTSKSCNFATDNTLHPSPFKQHTMKLLSTLRSCIFSLLLHEKTAGVVLATAFVFAFATSCQKSLDEKVAENIQRFNRTDCPTPPINNIRTDSVTFDASKHLITYHCSFCGILDSKEIVELNKSLINNLLINRVKESTSMKNYLDAGYRFRYICHSDSMPQTVFLELMI